MAKSEHERKDSVQPSLADAIRSALMHCESARQMTNDITHEAAIKNDMDTLRAALPRAEAADALAEAVDAVDMAGSWTGPRNDLLVPRDLFQTMRAALRRYRESS